MAKGAWVQPEVPIKVAEIYNKMKDKGKIPTAKEVHEELERLLRAGGKEELSTSLRTVQLIITKVRKNEPREEKIWSIGISAREGIPDEAIEDIIKVWRWSVTVGHPFTVREAKWISRLRCAVPRKEEKDFRSLHLVASMYAARERAIESMGDANYETQIMDRFIFYVGGLITVLGLTDEDISRGVKAGKELMDSQLVDKIPEDKIEKPKEYLTFVDPAVAVEKRLGLTVDHREELPLSQNLGYCSKLNLLEYRTEWKNLTLKEKNQQVQSIYDAFLKNMKAGAK